MKQFYHSFLLLLLSISANAQTPFIIKVKTNSSQQYVTIPIVNTGSTNYSINYGDGSQQSNQTGNSSHTYNNPGTYTVTISGNFDRINYGQTMMNINYFDIVSIEQWGSTVWKSFERAFYQCSNLIVNATDAPNLTQVTSMKEAFYLVKGFTTNLNAWDVSHVTNMSKMFSRCTNFNQPLNNWNVGNVTDMSEMFFQCQQFNQPLNSWNVTNVSNMSGMFSRCHQFNQSLNAWDVSGVSNFSNMFYYCSAYNQPMDNWNLSSATDLSSMFGTCLVFNQPLNSWNVSSVTNMSGMFGKTEAFNQPLNEWNVSSVTDMSNMFSLSRFNSPIGMWDVSNVTKMYYMFYGSDYFNQLINTWDVSNVTDMESMFNFAVFNQPLEGWDVSNVTNMKEMFSNNITFNQPLNDWDVSSVTDMGSLFEDATAFNQPLAGWDVSSVTNMYRMFIGATAFNQNINSWNVANVTSMESMFASATAFNQPLNDWDVTNVFTMLGMFRNATAFNQPLNNWDVSGISDINSMFSNAAAFNQNLASWNFGPNAFPAQAWAHAYFVSGSGLDTQNYDALLAKFAQLDYSNKYFNFQGLEYCNAAVRNHLVNEKGWTIVGDTANPACIQNTLTGFVRYDANANGCDANDVAVTSFLVNATSNGITAGASVAADAIYDLKVANETYTVNLTNVPSYFTVNPASTTVTFTDFGNTENLNFCLTSNQTVNDLNVTLLPVTEARPGFPAEYQLVVQNMGTQNAANVTVVLVYDSTKQTFVSAVPSPSATASGQLTFALSNLQALQSRRFDLVMQTLTPPTVNGGDILNFTATVTPNTADATPQDNTFVLAQTVINSYDPNDKQVLQGDEIFIEEADQYLDYIIRFQNTGSASAIFVRIEDELHENLDWTTLRLVSASHAYRVEVTEGNHVEFIFDNINLPHEAEDAAGSNGFVAYKIKPKQNIQVGDTMMGNAAIYFDYNLPIITNMVSTEIVQHLSTPDFASASIRVYPNPTDGKLFLQSTNGTSITGAAVFSLQGKELLRFTAADVLDLNSLSAGMYLLDVETPNGKGHYKIIRK